MTSATYFLRQAAACFVGVIVAGCVSVPSNQQTQSSAPASIGDDGPFGVIVRYPTFSLPTAHAEPVMRVPGEPLEPFFAALDDLAAGKIKNVNILQLGDSHTAGDGFSGRLRTLLQEKFGNGGRGMLPPGEPFPYYRPTDVSVTAKGWAVSSSFVSHPQGPFGVTGFRARATQASALMTLQPQSGNGFEQVDIEVMLQPGGGTLIARADGVEVAHASTNDSGTSTGLMRLPLKGSTKRIELSTKGDGPVDVLSWSVGRRNSGVVLDSQGIVGTTVSIIDHWDRKTLSWELASRHPALILVVYGTNEGFGDGLSATAYAADFSRELALLHQLAPWAGILVVGPPDGEHLPAGCPSASSPKVHYTCAPLSTSDLQNYSALFRVSHPKGKACRWYEPPNLEVVRTIQQQTAFTNHVGFWDWSQVMGSACGLHKWVEADPPLAARDHIHMTNAGYSRSADALFGYLMQSYGTWQKAAQAALSAK